MSTGTQTPPATGEGNTPPAADVAKVAAEKAAQEAAAKAAKENEAKDLGDAKKQIAELNKENEARRKSEKELKARLEKLDKVAAILTGKEETPDPAELVKEQTETRVRDAYLKASFVGVAAREMHDADFVFDALKGDLADVKVDTKTGKVDTEAVKVKLAELKKAKPFLFVIQTSQNNGTQQPAGHPDGNGQPRGSNPYQTWKDLQAAPGRQSEAAKYYAENKAAIFANMPKG